MGERFRDALIWHMERHGTTIAELSKGSGVSADVIKKLRTGHSQSTDVEKAIALASFYGKQVEAFIRQDAPAEDAAMSVLASLLTEPERRLLVEQIRQLLDARDLQAS